MKTARSPEEKKAIIEFELNSPRNKYKKSDFLVAAFAVAAGVLLFNMEKFFQNQDVSPYFQKALGQAIINSASPYTKHAADFFYSANSNQKATLDIPAVQLDLTEIYESARAEMISEKTPSIAVLKVGGAGMFAMGVYIAASSGAAALRRRKLLASMPE